ncbi:RING finger protein 145-like [Anoplophora glabripennis]|uniref:RING finger protein 145-like n=1 Tax=Anoplophora glabripennis TaxID=217634 RepID=UPI000C785CD5|nr:RING finger protein 145-like [Anoplophora glabripennis]
MSTLLLQHSSDSILNSEQRWLPVISEVVFGIGKEIMEEMHCMEQFFIKLQNIYAFVCQVCFFILWYGIVEEEEIEELRGEKGVITALTTILFYSVFGYFATRIRDICQNGRARSIQSTLSMRSYFKWLCKIILEWAKAVVIVLCLREQGINYDPSLIYSIVTFVYYLCTERIFLEIIPSLIEILNIESMENLEHLYVPLFLNILTIISGIVLICVTLLKRFSNFVLLTIYFLVYLRIKDAYYNYWLLLVAERETYSSFRSATEREIQEWADICAVCLNHMSRARITPCNHLFHPYCLKQCLKTSFYCPLCKRHFMETSGES